MNKTVAILFLALLFILIQSKTLSFAETKLLNADNQNTTSHNSEDEEISDDNHSNINSTSSAHREDNEDENENENESEDDGIGSRRIVARPSLLLPTVSPTVTPTPTLTGRTLGVNTTSDISTETKAPTVTPTPANQELNLQNSQAETQSASFNFIKELEKLLISLKKIIFTTLG